MLATLLEDFDVDFRQLEQDIINASEAFLQPFKNTELSWTSADETCTGKTSLSHRMKKFLKIVDFEDNELTRNHDDWNKVQDELMEFLVEIAGPEGVKKWEVGGVDAKDFVSHEQRVVREMVEAERKQYLEQIEEASMVGMNRMKDSEKVS